MLPDKLIAKYNDIDIQIDIPDRVQAIIGDSGAGKSYMIDLLESMLTGGIDSISINMNASNIVIWRKASDINKNIYGKLIIIDRYDYLKMSDPDIVNFILKSNNQFIVMANSYLEELNLPGSRIYLIEVGENIRSNRKFITVPYLGSDYSRITPKHKMIEKYLK